MQDQAPEEAAPAPADPGYTTATASKDSIWRSGGSPPQQRPNTALAAPTPSDDPRMYSGARPTTASAVRGSTGSMMSMGGPFYERLHARGEEVRAKQEERRQRQQQEIDEMVGCPQWRPGGCPGASS